MATARINGPWLNGWYRGVAAIGNAERNDSFWPVALVRSHQKLPLAQRACIRALKPSNVSNAERSPRFALANEQRRLRFVTGQAE
jgi:hypothetical protein